MFTAAGAIWSSQFVQVTLANTRFYSRIAIVSLEEAPERGHSP